jgi:hypothetical protein
MPLDVASDATATCHRQTPLYQRFQLARFAEWESGGAEQVYRLTAQALARASAQGLRPEAILGFLQRHARSVPDPVRQSLLRWAARRGRVTYRQAYVLAVASEQDLETLRKTPGVGELLGEQLGPKSVLVAPENWNEISKRLAELGYL